MIEWERAIFMIVVITVCMSGAFYAGVLWGRADVDDSRVLSRSYVDSLLKLSRENRRLNDLIGHMTRAGRTQASQEKN